MNDEIEFVSEVGCEVINVAASDEMVAMAAWVSNDADAVERLADKEKVAGLIKFLYRNKHMSPFEHGVFTFKVDVPLFVAREFHRHRTASYNEVSGRYTQMRPRFWIGRHTRVQKGKMGNYFFEPGTPAQDAIYIASKAASAKADWDEYTRRLDVGIAKEQAREDLPLSLMTQFYVTMNPRNLMQFLTLRNDKHALAEIRAIAIKMEAVLEKAMPLTYAAYKAGRHEESIDVESIQRDLKILRQENAELRATKAELEEALKKQQVNNQKQQELYNDLNTKYNALYVADQERKRLEYKPEIKIAVDSSQYQDQVEEIARLVEKRIKRRLDRR